MSSLMPRQTMSCTVKACHSNPEQLVYSEDPNFGKVRFHSPDIKGWVYQYKETNPMYSVLSCALLLVFSGLK